MEVAGGGGGGAQEEDLIKKKKRILSPRGQVVTWWHLLSHLSTVTLH